MSGPGVHHTIQIRYWRGISTIVFAGFGLILLPATARAGGWYLLAPEQRSIEETLRQHPNIRDDWQIADATLNLERPISEWSHIRSFDTATECEQFLPEHGRPQTASRLRRLLLRLGLKRDEISILDVLQVVPEKIAKDHPQLQAYLEGNRASYSRCIATDDPRLLASPPRITR